MNRPRIAVGYEELVKAIFIWIKVAPASIWRSVEKQAKLPDHETPLDPRKALATHIAEKLKVSHWEVSRPEPVLHSSALGSPVEAERTGIASDGMDRP